MTPTSLISRGLLAACCVLPAMSAQAVRIEVVSARPDVVDTVIRIQANAWQYGFAITNHSWSIPSLSDSVRIVEFDLPYFADAGLSAIHAPVGWTWKVDSADSFGLGNGAQTLVWTATAISFGIAGTTSDFFQGFPVPPGDTLSGFSFVAPFAPVKAPYAVKFEGMGTMSGDPALPGSPAAIAAGLTVALPVSTVPEPAGLALLSAGLLLLIGRARWRGAITSIARR
jgi:hypothetical protein